MTDWRCTPGCLSMNDEGLTECGACGKPRRKQRAYARGADFERRVKAKLEAMGWLMFRSAGSHSQADLIGLWPADRFAGDDEPEWMENCCTVILVQCKGGAARMSGPSRERFRKLAEDHGASAIVALRGLTLEAA